MREFEYVLCPRQDKNVLTERSRLLILKKKQITMQQGHFELVLIKI